ncbi:MAG: ribosomal RNA small subunit methyltransferase A [Planctomycetota bacterium]
MAGQTLREIRALLEQAGLTPQHRFGQNFLIDLNLMRKAVEAAAVGPGDWVLEVGPGTGSLTEMLLDTGAGVVVVEIDRGFQELLAARLGERPNFTLIRGDILAGKHAVNPQLCDLLAASRPPRKLVANLPYQVATPLLLNLLLQPHRFEHFVVTIQLEVGQRLAAAANTDAYGPISVIAQSLATIRTLARLGPGAFWPPPKVDSVMLEIVPLDPGQVGIDDVPLFVDRVQRAFQRRRKVLRQMLADLPLDLARRVFEDSSVNWNSRPESLTPSDWRRFHHSLSLLAGPR